MNSIVFYCFPFGKFPRENDTLNLIFPIRLFHKRQIILIIPIYALNIYLERYSLIMMRYYEDVIIMIMSYLSDLEQR